MSTDKIVLNGVMCLLVVIAFLADCLSLFAFYLVIAAFCRQKHLGFFAIGSVVSLFGIAANSGFLYWFLLFYRFY